MPAIDVADQFVRGTATLASGEQFNVVIGSEVFNNVTVTDSIWQINRDHLGELTKGSIISVSLSDTYICALLLGFRHQKYWTVVPRGKQRQRHGSLIYSQQ